MHTAHGPAAPSSRSADAGPGRRTNRHPPISVPHDSAPHRTWGQPASRCPVPTPRTAATRPVVSCGIQVSPARGTNARETPPVSEVSLWWRSPGPAFASCAGQRGGRKRYRGAGWEQPRRRVTLHVGPDGMAIFAGGQFGYFFAAGWEI